jgi:hypothetical protein
MAPAPGNCCTKCSRNFSASSAFRLTTCHFTICHAVLCLGLAASTTGYNYCYNYCYSSTGSHKTLPAVHALQVNSYLVSYQAADQSSDTSRANFLKSLISDRRGGSAVLADLRGDASSDESNSDDFNPINAVLNRVAPVVDSDDSDADSSSSDSSQSTSEEGSPVRT